MCWWKAEKKEINFLLREIAESWGWQKRHWGPRNSTKHNLFLYFILAVSIISFSLSWYSMVEIILFTCSVGDQVGFVVQFILSALSTLSEFVLNDARVELAQELVGEQEPAQIAQKFPGVSQIHPSSKDASLVLCNSQLFCSGAMAEPGEVFAVQPQCCLLTRLKNIWVLPGLDQENRIFPVPWTWDSWLLAFYPWENHPSFTLSWLKPSQTEQEQPVTPLLLERLGSGIWI